MQKALKPLRKLRKLLKNFPADPRPEEVHSLRTQTRRMEAMLDTVDPQKDAETKLLLKLMSPVRKAAGKVRDMDVLIANLLAMRTGKDAESAVQLVEYLAATRSKHADRLCRTVDKRRKKARRVLKQYAQRLQHAAGNGATEIQGPDAGPEGIVAELRRWPKLSPQNLHEFRIRVKELHYMLELRQHTGVQSLKALKKVKDTAGEWHDWLELRGIADKVLDTKEDKAVLTAIASTQKEKLNVALAAANGLRKNKLTAGN